MARKEDYQKHFFSPCFAFVPLKFYVKNVLRTTLSITCQNLIFLSFFISVVFRLMIWASFCNGTTKSNESNVVPIPSPFLWPIFFCFRQEPICSPTKCRSHSTGYGEWFGQMPKMGRRIWGRVHVEDFKRKSTSWDLLKMSVNWHTAVRLKFQTIMERNRYIHIYHWGRLQ